MFSTAQLDLMIPLVAQMRSEGYLYYLAFQNQLTGSNYDYDLYIYFSKEEITSSDGYSYLLPADSLKYSIRSGNASTYSTGSRLDLAVLDFEQSVVVDSYQHISTNCCFTGVTLQPDLTFTEVRNNEASSGLLFMFSVFIFFFAFLKLFRR